MTRRARFTMFATIGLAATLTGVAVADPTPPTPTPPTSGTETARTALDNAAPADQANAEAQEKAKAEARARLDEIIQRGKNVSVKTRTSTETRLDATARQLNAHATTAGDQKVAERFATEFGMTTDAVLAEKQTLGASWGEWMIAHSLMANAGSQVTMEQLFEMRKDAGWGVIAGGMNLNLGEMVSAVHAEGQVGLGLAKADGKVATVHERGAVSPGTATGARAGGSSAAGGASAVGKVKAGR